MSDSPFKGTLWRNSRLLSYISLFPLASIWASLYILLSPLALCTTECQITFNPMLFKEVFR